MTIARTRFRVTLQHRPDLAERTEEVWADSFDVAAEHAREKHPETIPIAVELVRVARPEPAVVGCLQFSSPAWRMAARDRWVGWDDATRQRNLQQVVQNSRFLLLPWVRVRNLATTVLARAARRLPEDWWAHYRVRPLLLETLVDARRYAGTCYRAANWIEVGQTTGRGRMDREHARQGAAPKRVWLYPLGAGAADALRAG